MLDLQKGRAASRTASCARRAATATTRAS